MKTKILLTSALAISIACPAMSDPLPAITSCTEPQIGTATGPASLEADWSANRINLNWVGNGAAVSGGASICTYAETFTLPQAPTRIGYNFAGWKVKPNIAECNGDVLSFLHETDPEEKETFFSKSLDEDVCDGMVDGHNYDATDCMDARFLSLAPGEWTVYFWDTLVKGKAQCRAFPEEGFPEEQFAEDEPFCWCQATTVIPDFDDMCSLSSSPWLSLYMYTGEEFGPSCASYCAYACARTALYEDDFRAALFGLVAN